MKFFLKRNEPLSIILCSLVLGYAIPECGSGKNCNGLFDHTISTVRLPASLATGQNGNPTDADVVEAVCYTRTAQHWMVDKYNQDKSFWQAIGVSSPQMFFGSSTGVFRIFPARHSRECGMYDPRSRPWFQAAVSIIFCFHCSTPIMTARIFLDFCCSHIFFLPFRFHPRLAIQ